MSHPLIRPALLATVVLALGSGAAQAAVCVRPGFPVGCTVGAVPVNGPVVNPTPGVGYGAPGAGFRPAAGPGVGPNTGAPVNRPGLR
jgi:hypothetical protein